MSLAHHLRLAGTGLVVLALLHAAFPRRFNWSKELPRLSLLNRQIYGGAFWAQIGDPALHIR